MQRELQNIKCLLNCLLVSNIIKIKGWHIYCENLIHVVAYIGKLQHS